MKIIKTALTAAAAIVIFLNASCLKETQPETSPQAAIRSITLGNFHVRTNDISWLGRDTVVYPTHGGAMYPFTIDQIGNRIYNVDSLAYGSLVSSVTCSVSSNGTVYYKYLDEEGDIFYAWSSTEPIDFTRPLKFCVISSDLSYVRNYDFQLNIRTVHPDSVTWNASDTVGYTVLGYSTAVVLNDTLYNMGLDGAGNPAVATVSIRSGRWNTPAAMDGLDPAGWTGYVCLFDSTFLTVCSGQLYSSYDAVSWRPLKTGVAAIISAGLDSPYMWIRTTDGMLVRTEDLISWTQSQPVPADFPDSIAGAATYPLQTNSSIYRTVLTGMKDGATTVWTMLSNDSVWSRIKTAPYSVNTLPVLNSLSVIRYDSNLFAFASGFDGFWESQDNGANWFWCDSYIEEFNTWNNFMQFPEGLKGDLSSFSYAVDGLGSIWIMTYSGQVWRGSINRLNRR